MAAEGGLDCELDCELAGELQDELEVLVLVEGVVWLVHLDAGWN